MKRYLRLGGWAPYAPRAPRGKLRGLEHWLCERFVQHCGNADVVRGELEREHGIVVSLRTVERAVQSHRCELKALARATVRSETPPGTHLQVNFGETRVLIGEERVRSLRDTA